jgi:predicted metal-dependent phosphoesterase TrpH
VNGEPDISGPETISGRGESALFVDLQVHSTASDGALSPTRVVEAARDAKLYAIALTDHDTVDGVAEATAAGAEFGVRLIAGVELSSHFDDDELHLLGLHLSNHDAMRSALRGLQAGRVERAVRIVEVLNKHSIPVTMDAVLAELDWTRLASDASTSSMPFVNASPGAVVVVAAAALVGAPGTAGE